MNAPGPASSSAENVRVLARGLAVLRAFEPANVWRSNAELATLTGLPKPTVSRLTANLTTSGYLAYSPERGQYRLGAAVLALGYAAASNRDIRKLARPLMQAVANRHHASVVLASADGNAMTCHEVRHSEDMLFTLRVRAGSRLNLGQSALGRAYIASMEAADRARFLAALAVAEPQGWPARRAQIDAAVQQMARHGYCTAAGTLESGTNGIAVSIDTPAGKNGYSVGCAVPAAVFSTDRLEAEVGPDLLALKHRLEQDLRGSSAATPFSPHAT
ncbi:IclR family transcriptional regulator [Pigmentiphaga sp. NML080357]|uniref:IclR family transcriptional regulator n=1 Tax=Pigmentiphaga sp. NML080357 TaxID=2008675 RepID=UPI000B41CB0F|nr:IclR family transcriptional regulator [Pigmentiphaga sp. NML080357]OVZ59426.1 IclR family transcriptional regulator [Pigmentiphaga sp. NML080357]